MQIRLNIDVLTTPPWVSPKRYIRAGEVVNCFPATNLPENDKTAAVWIDDPRTCNIYGSYVVKGEYEVTE